MVEILWIAIGNTIVSSGIPGSLLRIIVLRAFGAKIGSRVVFKPSIKIKFPWKLEIGNDSWIGERIWIDNLSNVKIGSNCCISQNVYLCCGSHDWSSSTFDLITEDIEIDDNAWICAGVQLSAGTQVGEGTVVTLGSVASGKLEPWRIYSGHPAIERKIRRIVR